jgi:mannose-6-phosphate isomerase-like protein (cupin superfamily)
MKRLMQDVAVAAILIIQAAGTASAETFTRFSEQWQPKIVAELNGQEVKLVKVQGTFPWHHHNDVDELFLVWQGRFRVEFRDRNVELGPGEFVVVPRGVEHRTAADEEAEVILLEPAGVLIRET